MVYEFIQFSAGDIIYYEVLELRQICCSVENQNFVLIRGYSVRLHTVLNT